MRREIPEPWASAMVAAGITDPRNATRPSMNQLAQKIGVHTTTITSMVWGERETDQATLDKVAEVLHVRPSTVAEWAGRARTDETPYEPPAVASLMDQDQRNIVDAIIRQFTAQARRANTTREEVEDVEGATRMRPQSRARIQRELERVLERLRQMEAEDDPDLYGPQIEAHRAEVSRLKSFLQQDGRQAHQTGS